MFLYLCVILFTRGGSAQLPSNKQTWGWADPPGQTPPPGCRPPRQTPGCRPPWGWADPLDADCRRVGQTPPGLGRPPPGLGRPFPQSWADPPGLGRPPWMQIPPGLGRPPWMQTLPWVGQTPHPTRYGQQAGSTHPTGMHTCLFIQSSKPVAFVITFKV